MHIVSGFCALLFLEVQCLTSATRKVSGGTATRLSGYPSVAFLFEDQDEIRAYLAENVESCADVNSPLIACIR